MALFFKIKIMKVLFIFHLQLLLNRMDRLWLRNMFLSMTWNIKFSIYEVIWLIPCQMNG
jgi:hypothetical protein